MKNIILSQKINFAEIEMYKDYCRLDEKPEKEAHLNYCGSTINNLFVNIVGDRLSERPTREMGIYSKDFGRRKNTRFYYSNPNEEFNIRLQMATLSTHYTQNDHQIKRHYGRPLSSVTVKTMERSVAMEGNKLYIRFNIFLKRREANAKFFKKNSTSFGLVFDFEKGNILTYESLGKRAKGKFRQSNFSHLTETLNQLLNIQVFKTLNPNADQEYYTSYNKMAKAFRDEFDNEEFIKIIYHTICSNTNVITNYIYDSLTSRKDLYDMFMKLFVDINKIKVSNDYEKLMTDWYPTKKYLKKNENKLVAAALDKIGLKSKTIIKLVHSNPNLDLNKLLVLSGFFGKNDLHKYINNIQPNYFTSDWDLTNHVEFFKANNKQRSRFLLNQSEKTNTLKLINAVLLEFTDASNLLGRTMSSVFSELADHFLMIDQVREYFPDIQLRATNGKDFHTEHIELSKLQRTIKKGYSIRYNFDESMIKTIEEPIEVMVETGEFSFPCKGIIEVKKIKKTFYPYILKLDNEYGEEGSHMHHCVASYADKENSIIVSLREDSVSGSERVTSEFSVNGKHCIQSKYFCNAQPPKIFEEPLAILTSRISSYKKSIKSISKEKIPLVINGVEIKAPEPKQDFIDLVGQHLLLPPLPF
jgi:hypothetical protein